MPAQSAKSLLRVYSPRRVVSEDFRSLDATNLNPECGTNQTGRSHQHHNDKKNRTHVELLTLLAERFSRPFNDCSSTAGTKRLVRYCHVQ
jgi:hypothetical protein